MVDEARKKTWAVTIPMAGHLYVVVEANDEQAAIAAAMAECTIDDLNDWEALDEGNVCYCPHPWQAEAIDETPDEVA